MKKKTVLILLFILLLTTTTSGDLKKRSAENPKIAKIITEISPRNIETIIKKLVSFHTRHTLSDQESEAVGIGAAARWIKAEFDRYSQESGNRLKVELDETTVGPAPRIPKATKLTNIVATLPGTKPESSDRIYVVSGHYDSRASDPLDAKSFAPGANDDASGTAAVMEMARVMSKYEFDATLVFMAVAGEEQGLHGSTHWAEMAKERKLNIEGMITNDIIGSSKDENGHINRNEVRLFAEGLSVTSQTPADLRTTIQTGGENDTPTRQLARRIKELAEEHIVGMKVTIIYRRDRYLRGGDHSPFLDRGYPAVRMSEPNEDYKHQHQDVRKEGNVQYGDLPEFVDYQYVARVARVNAAALAGLALAPAPPKKVEVETINLENSTTLRWEANQEADLAGYQIVWRETTAPNWQKKLFVGNVTRYTVKGISKDNYLFGVQAVDKDGNRSLAVYPKPYRQ
ncbi:MAG: M28 family metallopeptidase [Blastocatellia bacterium]|nr:M28 family metallopeptidase [Blastocatellia bacterium]